MGLTRQSTGIDTLCKMYVVDKKEDQYIFALAGNPNTGKSTVFNALTGLKQHTGNWPGKTVTNARGFFRVSDKEYILVDLPGTYSIFASSVEEEVARDFICFGNVDAVIVVTDATCLERNLNLVYQVMELTDNVILCINLIDEAIKKNIVIHGEGIEKELGIPVVLCSARSGIGLEDLKEKIYRVSIGDIKPRPNKVVYQPYIESMLMEILPLVEEKVKGVNSKWLSLRFIDGDESILNTILMNMESKDIEKILQKAEEVRLDHDKNEIREDITCEMYKKAEYIRDKYVTQDKKKDDRDRKIDNIITSRIFGIPIMLLMLAVIFWITITGANIPSKLIADVLFNIEDRLTAWSTQMNAPYWLQGILIQGVYRTLAWVISVMLPPMAIFFPLFTLLEDLGYLPRVAFNLDHMFKRACAHGKQCLTMCMGLGCNAAGIVGCRIIESPRERLIAILTNNFMPCNGRFPTLLAISSAFLIVGSKNRFASIVPALIITSLVTIGVVITLLVSFTLSKTLLKGVPSSFTLELPPYRKPQITRVLYTSIIDRTIFVLGRSVAVAAPAGAVTWILANINIGDISILSHIANFLQPVANLIGLDGFILMAFILGLPANEIVLPILLMSYLATGKMTDFASLESLKQILVTHGWNYLTCLNVMLFSLFHWPCATTLLTIKKETGSIKWTVLSAAIPTGIAFILCFITATVARVFGLV
ncbi:MAG: ferrous iron transport protein B [Clostridiaceae bacterium]|nr:ferrous iron transport protein B [Clostridiaceae bacterium]